MKVFHPVGLLLMLTAAAGNLQARCWQTADDVEPVRFTASQTGAPINGSFSVYRGQLCLPGKDDSGSASVEIETASIDMGLPEFDAEMRGELFFNSARWPTAKFTADRLEPEANDRYRISGTLTIRDISRPLTTKLTFTPQDERLRVTGEISLSRLAFDIGIGEWRDTQWVGDEVTITLDNLLVPARQGTSD